MIKILYTFVILLSIELIWNCNQNRKKLSDANLFMDGIKSSSGLVLFNLLDPYPSLKQAFKSLKVEDFNTRLDSSLRLSAREDILGVLRMVQKIFLNSRVPLQNLLSETSKILSRIQRNNPTTYSNLQPLFERIRSYQKPVIRNLIPITTNYLLTEYNSKNTITIGNQVLSFANELANQNSRNLLEEYQDLAVKALRLNTVTRSSLEELLTLFFEPSFGGDKQLKDSAIELIYSIGEMLYRRGGINNDTSSESVLKTLMINFEKYFTNGGANHSGAYTYSDGTAPVIKSTELRIVVIDLYTLIRQFIIPPSIPKTRDSNSILVDSLAQNLASLEFTKTISGVESSLLDMLYIDSMGRNRRTDSTSSPISALESLFLTLSIVDIYGFTWDSTTTNSWITASSNGFLTIADALWSLQSLMQSGTQINFKSIIELSRTSNQVFKSNTAGSLVTLGPSGTGGIQINTPVLALLERESIGSALPIEQSGSDTIYRKTVPWVLNWIKRVTYSGYGPYYNINRKDSSGNFLSPDGSIARYANLTENNFKPSWKTARYKICQQRSGPTTKDIGLGGNEYAGTCNVANPGTDYTIYEINKTDSERGVSSDEEAFYKNFQWLLYEKRFVVIIPARAKLDASLNFEESLFIIGMGNGLKGLMSVKPYCPSGSSASCGGANNGIWQNNTSISLRNAGTSYLDLTPANFSDKAGDSALYIQGWGYGAAGNLAFQEAFVLQSNAVWPLLIPNPTQVYGLIPPVISLNFPVLERLGFTNSTLVTPSLTSSNWNKRNRLLPLIVALAKTLDDQVDVANNKNPYEILTDLSKLLSRPYLLKEADNTAIPNPQYGVKPTILSFRLTDDNPIRNASATSLEYQASEFIFSPLAFLIESQRRFQDGALVLFAKTDSINYLLRFLAVLGEPSRTSQRNRFWLAIQRILGEIKINSDGVTASNQFNFEQWVLEKVNELAAYPDSRSSNIRHSSWAGVDDSIAFYRDYFSKTSGYSLIKSLDFALGMLIDIRPSGTEIKSALDLLDSLFAKESNGRYNLTNILTDFVPPVLREMAPNGRNLFGLFYSLASPGGFIDYTEKNMSFAPYSVSSLISDTESLLNSNMIRTSESNANSLLFSTGTLIGLFADIYQYGKKMDSVGFPFADGLNINEQTTIWHRMNILLSTKN
jgi:hypothetical protein